MGNCTDPNASQHDRQEFPAIWKLERDDVALANAQGIQPKRDAVGCRRKLGIGEPGNHPALTGPRSDRRRFRMRGDVAVEEVRQDAVMPCAGGPHGGDPAVVEL